MPCTKKPHICACSKEARTTTVPAARGYLTSNEAAVIAGVMPGTIRSWCVKGILGSKCGPENGPWRIKPEDLKRVAGEWC